MDCGTLKGSARSSTCQKCQFQEKQQHLGVSSQVKVQELVGPKLLLPDLERDVVISLQKDPLTMYSLT